MCQYINSNNFLMKNKKCFSKVSYENFQAYRKLETISQQTPEYPTSRFYN